ncbi:acyl-CoA thioester hydrolase/BAAT C-terminal domain-containing protein [Bowmanella dokdonensis]|uniref:Dienelactone hydrolase n=1 Tax=Bowmanella dokdonensis TaxID=751969 RepID=A0A939IMK1_9ALTE|nr:acyl-CoA thioester hydrolase/BAAT C-terminal domain-containing protein [Bowmanella dokdonensis]MBN7825388.1 dienelactone hydrolase [Bowmanella dokdonensis]
MLIRTLCIICLLVLPLFALAESAGPVSVRDKGLVGHYYTPASQSGKQPVLVLGGSEGGIPDKLAKPVAEAGFPVLALAYFNAPGLPDELEKIPLEYFHRALDWLAAKHRGSRDGIILVGWSKGAELALLLASHDAGIQRVVAIAPSSVLWAGILKDWQKVPDSSWTLDGKPLSHVPFNPGGPVSSLRDLYDQSLANRKDGVQADIPVENIKGRVTLLTGTQDEIWPSSQMAEAVCQRMNATRQTTCRHLNYQDLDHLLDYRFLDPSTPVHAAFVGALEGRVN